MYIFLSFENWFYSLYAHGLMTILILYKTDKQAQVTFIGQPEC